MNGARKEARGSRGCAWSCFALRRQLGLPWLLAGRAQSMFSKQMQQDLLPLAQESKPYVSCPLPKH